MQSALSAYLRYVPGKRAVVVCSHVAAAEHVARTFEKMGIPSAAIHARTPKAVRQDLITKFNIGELKILCGACLLLRASLGIQADAVIDMRATHNQERHRLVFGFVSEATGVVIDMTMNTFRHGVDRRFNGSVFVPASSVDNSDWSNK